MIDYNTAPEPDEITPRDIYPELAEIAGRVSLIEGGNFNVELAAGGILEFSKVIAPYSSILVTECSAGYRIEVYPSSELSIRWITSLGDIEAVCDLIGNSSTCS